MMNKTFSRICRVLGIALVLFVAPFQAMAGDEAKQDKNQRIEAILKQPKVEYSNEYESLGLKRDERRAIGQFRYERGARELHAHILRDCKLTDLQKKAVARIIEDQLAYVREMGGRPPVYDGRPRDPLAEPGSENALLDPAKELVDPATKGKYSGKADIVNRNRPPATMFDDGSTLANLIATELSGAQIVAYEKVAARWKALRPHGVADGPLRHIFRTLRDPSLNVDLKERRELQDILQKSMTQLRSRRGLVENRLKAFDETKSAIVARLAPPQREHFEKTLKYLQRKHAEEVLMVMDMRAKDKSKGQKKPTRPKP